MTVMQRGAEKSAWIKGAWKTNTQQLNLNLRKKKIKTFASLLNLLGERESWLFGERSSLINLHCNTLYLKEKQKHKQKLLFSAVHSMNFIHNTRVSHDPTAGSPDWYQMMFRLNNAVEQSSRPAKSSYSSNRNSLACWRWSLALIAGGDRWRWSLKLIAVQASVCHGPASLNLVFFFSITKDERRKDEGLITIVYTTKS